MEEPQTSTPHSITFFRDEADLWLNFFPRSLFYFKACVVLFWRVTNFSRVLAPASRGLCSHGKKRDLRKKDANCHCPRIKKLKVTRSRF